MIVCHSTLVFLDPEMSSAGFPGSWIVQLKCQCNVKAGLLLTLEGEVAPVSDDLEFDTGGSQTGSWRFYQWQNNLIVASPMRRSLDYGASL